MLKKDDGKVYYNRLTRVGKFWTSKFWTTLCAVFVCRCLCLCVDASEYCHHKQQTHTAIPPPPSPTHFLLLFPALILGQRLHRCRLSSPQHHYVPGYFSDWD
jgi:hypothetical protein